MTCKHGFVGPCAECDGAGQEPPREERARERQDGFPHDPAKRATLENKLLELGGEAACLLLEELDALKSEIFYRRERERRDAERIHELGVALTDALAVQRYLERKAGIP